MRSTITTTHTGPVMDDSLNSHDPFPHLDPTLHPPLSPNPNFFAPQPSFSPYPAPSSPAMDLRYILSPNMLLDDQQPPDHESNPFVLSDQLQPVPIPSAIEAPLQPVPSSSRSVDILSAPVVRRSGEHVHPNPDDAIINFDSKTRSFPKPIKPSTPAIADPYAEDFLRDKLGTEKWETFSTRLFERRLGGKAKGKGKGKQGDDDDPRPGASAIEFLVKVEVVKEILRNYVPNPYNPLKSLTHAFPRSPTGHVTLTRSTVLLLSGWSNTQFSYWARRSEAVSVLAEYDPKLHAVHTALERRLRSERPSSTADHESEAALVTGKGLDLIIEDVKKRTGKSQFLRGKHSSLDAFGTTIADLDPHDSGQGLGFIPPPSQYAMPTFQAEQYVHGTRASFVTKVPPSLSQNPPPVGPPVPPKRRLRPLPPPPGVLVQPVAHAVSSSSASTSEDQSASLSSSMSASERTSSQPESPCPRTTRSSMRKAAVASDDNAHHFPVSDSRSEVESLIAGKKRKVNDSASLEGSSTKRARNAVDEEET